jgi:hypothetical protein
MSSPTGSRRAEVCWNCDRPVDASTEVFLSTPAGGSARLRLCGTCYTAAYRPLVRALEGVREQRDHLGACLIIEEGSGVHPEAE